MGLYDFKEFLTFDDVVEYLIDLNIYDRNISKDYLGKKTRDNLLQFVKEEKINPIVYCHSVFFARAISYNTSCYKIESGYYDGYMFLDKYTCIDILNIGYMDSEEYNLEHTTYNGEKTETKVFLGFNFKPALTIKSSFDEFIAENKQLFIDFFPIALDENKTIRYTDFLYLKSELDAIFNPNQTTNTDTATLQAQLDQAHARIAELERQLSQREQEQYAPRHSHTNEALQALNDVINEFWQDPNNPPKQEFIKAHIVSNYPSIDPSKALWIDKIIRHNDKK